MALIANVNGKPVYSDKRMASINNNRITFSDGSWCNVKTGEVHNTGPGFINIGGSDSGSNAETTTEGPKRFTASSLELRTIDADVTVEVSDDHEIEYTITGPSDKLKSIQATVRAGALIIEGDGNKGNNGSINISTGRNSFSISSIGGMIIGGGVSIGGGGGSSDTKVLVKVPKGTPVNSNRVVGKVTIGDIEANLIANVQAGDIKAGRIKNAQLGIQGSGNITIKEVDGTVMAQVQGSGNIEIKNGLMTALVATVQGSGDITIGGVAQQAALTVMGSGDIRVERVLGQPTQSTMGSGKIRVRHIG
jgi:hypothetical protein